MSRLRRSRRRGTWGTWSTFSRVSPPTYVIEAFQAHQDSGRGTENEVEGRLPGPQPVADSRFGHDPAGVGGIVFELAPQVVDVDAKLLGVFGGVAAPDPLQQRPVREHFIGIRGEHREQIELSWGEMGLLARLPHNMAGEIDGDVAERELRRGGCTGAPKQRAQPREQ